MLRASGRRPHGEATSDFGENGFADTRRYLESQRIAAVGHPRRVDQNYAYTRHTNGRQFSFVSLNATLRKPFVSPYRPQR